MGVKSWLRRNLPSPRKLRESRQIRFFGELLHDPRLWHLNRRSVAGGVAVGGFCMFFPPLGQIFVAAAVAIRARVNLPITLVVVSITNPLTMPAIYYVCYRIGALFLGHPPIEFRTEFWLDYDNWLGILAPLLLGNLLCAIVCSTLGYFVVQGLWRRRLRREIAERRRRLQALSTAGVRRPSSSRRT
jgi:uncharacterized protein (DUF2062 family)